jgi:leukotriene-A4 hydrolase
MTTFDPHSYADPQQGKITHVDFLFGIDFDSQTLQVRADYTLDQRVSGSLFLDTRDLQIERIYSNGKEIAWDIDQHDPILGQRLHLHGLQGISNFTIEHRTSPNASALQWLSSEQTSGQRHPFLYSQCQALHARSIFPCQDTPSIRLTYSAQVEVRSPLIAVLAAAMLGMEENGDIKRFQFDMPQPIPSYLFGLAAGDLAFRDLGPRTGIYAEPDVIEAAAWEFAENELILEQAEKLYGPYDWDRYDILILPPAFPYGGMENPRLTFMSPTYIVGDRSLTPIVTHELSHAWTGNLVTNATWEDFWLNEGWTTYAERRITEALEGYDRAQLRTAIDRNVLWEDLNRFGMDADPTCLRFSMKGIDPDIVFSTIPYHKGCAFLTLLEETAGRPAFDEFTRKYIETHRFQSITTDAFISFLKQELPQVADRVDLQRWIFEPGLPEDAPAIRSPLYDEVMAKVEEFQRGIRPSKEDISGWLSTQLTLFLRLLPEDISADDCRYIESLFNLKQSHNPTHLTYFYILAIRGGYREVLPRVEQFLATVGRQFLVSRIYRAMIQANWTRDQARAIFERCRPRYHSVTANFVENVFREAGL